MTLCRVRRKPGRAKAPAREASTLYLVLGSPLALHHLRLLRMQNAGRFKLEAYCLRSGGLGFHSPYQLMTTDNSGQPPRCERTGSDA